jgi:hypothetical protein
MLLTSKQYLDALKRFTPDSASKDFLDFLGELDEAGAVEKEGEIDWLSQLGNSQDEEKRTRAYNIHTAQDARKKIEYRQKSIDVASGVRIWAGKSADLGDIERDFTTPGTPGRLGCPFAGGKLSIPINGHHRGASTPRSSLSKPSAGRRSRKASFHDPIRAEECVSSPMSPERSVAGSMPLCPIRFLDQHSPEEVARYFEKHQHEVPPSHEFCIRRFENEDARKHFDSKYANIVSMVKDLQSVHRPLLPDTEDIAVEVEEDGEEEIVHTSASKVERWAQAVSASDEEHENDAGSDNEGRRSRFDRSLKDIRVGESPSRPWGIPVPEEFQQDGEEHSKKSDATASPLESEDMHKGVNVLPPLRCPFSGMKAANDEDMANSPHAPSKPTANSPEEVPQPPPVAASLSVPHFMAPPEPSNQTAPNAQAQMVFNGPVFFGYSFDQAMQVLKQSGLAP